VQYRARTNINNESLVPPHHDGQKVFNETPQYTGGYFAGFRSTSIGRRPSTNSLPKSFKGARSVACSLLVGVIVALAAGCGVDSEKISAAQVVGSWRGDGGGRMEFWADGRFEMSGIPRDAIVFSFIDTRPERGGCPGREPGS